MVWLLPIHVYFRCLCNYRKKIQTLGHTGKSEQCRPKSRSTLFAFYLQLWTHNSIVKPNCLILKTMPIINLGVLIFIILR